MKCERVREQLSACLDGELGGAAERVEGHLAECQSCCKQLGELRRVSSLLRVEEVAPDPYFLTRFRARRDAARRVDESLQGWRRLTLRFLLPTTAVAIALAAALVVAEQPEGRSFHDLEWHALSTGSTAVETDRRDEDSEPLLAASTDTDGLYGLLGSEP